MSWIIMLAIVTVGLPWVNKVPRKHSSGHFCRPQLMNAPLSLRKYSEGGREDDRDWCTGAVRRGRKWIDSDELIEGSWCPSERRREGDRCVPKNETRNP